MKTPDQKRNIITRRTMLRYAGTGMAAGFLSGNIPGAFVSVLPDQNRAVSVPDAGGKIPVSLIIDDGAPVDPLFYELPGYKTPFLVPAEFTKKVAETFDRFNIQGKFTLIPMPSCLGRIDQSLKRVPQEHLQEFLKIVRERIYPRFDITPEFLTHLCAYDLKIGQYKRHLFEEQQGSPHHGFPG
jgi:hypothetical protein